jgi:hypothetical protein
MAAGQTFAPFPLAAEMPPSADTPVVEYLMGLAHRYGPICQLPQPGPRPLMVSSFELADADGPGQPLSGRCLGRYIVDKAPSADGQRHDRVDQHASGDAGDELTAMRVPNPYCCAESLVPRSADTRGSGRPAWERPLCLRSMSCWRS